MLGEGYYLVGQNLVHDIGHRTYEEEFCHAGGSRAQRKKTLVEDDAAGSNYEYHIPMESEECD